MTFDEAINLPTIGRAASSVWHKFRTVPGFYLAVADLKQIGALSAWRLGDRIEAMDCALLYVIVIRDMYDAARAGIDVTRAQLAANDLPVVLSLDAYLDASADRSKPADRAVLGKEVLDLIEDRRCRLSLKERTAVYLYFCEDFTQAEIAQMCRVSHGMISQRIRKAITKMRRVVFNQPWPKMGRPYPNSVAA